MNVPPSITAVKAALYAASQNAIHASYVAGSDEVVEALQVTRDNITAAQKILVVLCMTDPQACAVRQSIEGLRTQLDGALRIARTLDPTTGQLPVGTVDPVFEGIELAADVLFASRWG